jgi:hypothetical protein
VKLKLEERSMQKEGGVGKRVHGSGIGTETRFPSGDENADGGLAIFVKTRMLLDMLLYILILLLLKKIGS